MRTFTFEMALAGMLVFGAGCGKTEETGDTGDTNDTDTNVPTTEDDCNDGDDNDQDGAEDCDDSDCATDSDCVFEIKAVSASGGFVYDATNDEITGGIWAGNAVAPFIAITLGNQDYIDTQGQTGSCEIDLVYNGTEPLTPENWDLNDGSYLGFVMPEGKYDVQSDCENLDEATLGTIEQIAASGWGVGIGPENADVTDLLDGAVDSGDLTAEQRAAYFGGGFFWGMDGVPDPFLNMSFSNGFEVDADFNVLAEDGSIAGSNDSPALIPADDVFAGALPPTGFYQNVALSMWQFQ